MSNLPPDMSENDQKFDLEFANKMQNMAADPLRSVFVSANAGSGKTRVLVSRVSRILLEGAAPEKILCLTYTKAAAAEMQERLFETLGKWSIMSDQELSHALDRMHNQSEGTTIRPQSDLKTARLLFARALETPGGLKVQTIHAFCEKILKRFPLEAGILPSSDALDDADKRDIEAHIIRCVEAEISEDIVAGRDTALARALPILAAVKSDQDLDKLYRWIIDNCYRVSHWDELGGMKTAALQLNIPNNANSTEYKQKAWDETPIADIAQAAKDMMTTGVERNITKAKIIMDAILLGKTNSAYAFDHYTSLFLTKEDKINAWKVSKAVGPLGQGLFGHKEEPDGTERVRVLAALAELSSVICFEQTQALYDLSMTVVARYRQEKKKRRVIDFNDQIHLARQLLCDTEARDWVRYKLDGGVSHILVDEAQDTSDRQWEIVDALSDPFFQPSPDHDPRKPRTLFAVGDEKQSIYSFQGARPELFLQKIHSLNEKSVDPERPSSSSVPQVQMKMSFRSSPQILNLVDQVFYEDRAIMESFDINAMPAGSDLGQHTAFRRDQGLVEFWPASKTVKVAESEKPWEPSPVDAADGSSSREQLAQEIAKQIRDWLDRGEMIFDRNLADKAGSPYRPMQAGDILILVKTRSSFYKALIRNLKSHNVPLAGADRLSLREALCIRDLISLAKFVLLPADDLSLGEVLKSPIFGWSEDALFALSRYRNQFNTTTLWGALRKAADLPSSETPASLSKVTASTLNDLLWIKSQARRHAPYEFFARVLAYVPSQEGGHYSMLQRFYNRMGTEITDHMEAFLAQALAHQRYGAPSLRQFIGGLERDESDIKRDMDGVFDAVRVMTVHGAKGLEAPVVILPDTTTLKTSFKDAVVPIFTSTSEASNLDNQENVPDKVLAKTQFGGYLFKPVGVNAPAVIEAAKQRKTALDSQESLRLLYVALTRAESRLLICGFESRDTVAADSWHDRLGRALGGMEASSIETPFGDGMMYGRYVADIEQADIKEQTIVGGTVDNSSKHDLPSWARQIYQPQLEHQTGLQYYSPSHLVLEGERPNSVAVVRSPLERAADQDGQGATGRDGRFARGNHIHKLLQVLPDLPLDLRPKWAQQYLKSQDAQGGEQHSEMIETVFAVLEHKDFAPFFAASDNGSTVGQAEISVAGRVAGLPSHIGFSGQIDRLCIVDGVVWILDYKSNRPPPKTAQDLPLVYVRQMAAYRALAREIFKDKPIRTAILWTDGPRLMPLDDKVLDAVQWAEVFQNRSDRY